MEPERKFSTQSDAESELTTTTTQAESTYDHGLSNYTTTQSTRWRRTVEQPRPDLEPGAEYAVTRTLTPARDPRSHDPAIWPDDLVDWNGPDDPANSRNWPLRKKIGMTLSLGMTTVGSAFASSSFSSAFGALENQFHVSGTVATLSLSLFVLGFAFGPLVFAPISELYGRKISFLPAYFAFGIFLIGVGASENIASVIILRFFAGLMASAPMSNVAGGLADMFDDRSRGMAIVLYSIAVTGGPTVGPIVGAALVESSLGWRWVEYITAIYVLTVAVLDTLFLPETYGPIILKRKANHLRHVTGNWALHSKLDEKELTVKEVVEKNLIRPLRMLFTEPIIFLFAIYNAFVYGLLYLLFEAFPIVFREERHWSPVVSTLPFLAVLFGEFLAAGVQGLYQPTFWKKLEAAKSQGKTGNPEARLPPMMFGGVFFAAGLFVFGWTADPKIHWIAPVVGAALIGLGFILIFQNSVSYLIDAFTVHAASSQAANTFFRSLAGAGFPLFATPMFHGLGVPWASSLLGFVALALVPIPFLFYVFGERIRAKSPYTDKGEVGREFKKAEA